MKIEEMFENYLSDLKCISIDDSVQPVEYVTSSTKSAVNFDAVAKEYWKSRNLSEIKSIDALIYTNGGKLAFIEFKNGFLGKKEKYGIRKKIYDSVFILGDIVSMKFSEIRDNVEFVLVYNRDKNLNNPDEDFQRKEELQHSKSFSIIENHVGKYAKQEIICFGLSGFKNYCFNDVHTYSKDEFEDYLQKISQE